MRLLDVAKYALLDSNTHEQYIDNLIIYEFNLPKIKERCYIKNNKYKFIALLDANKEELTKLSNGDKLMKEFKSEVDKMIEKNIDGCDEFTNDNDYSELVDSFNTYMRDIREYKLLSQEETKELFEKYHHGDEKARTILINSNQRLIVSIAKQFAYNKADLMDLIQEGNKGLIKAIDNFDYTLDYKLSTFAIYWIKQSIFSYLTCDCSNIKIPLRIKQLYNRLKKLLENYNNRGIIVSEKQLANILGVNLETLKQLRMIPDKTISLNCPCGEADDEAELMGFIQDDSSVDPSCQVLDEMINDNIMDIMKENLTNDEYLVLFYRFGFVDNCCFTYDKISKILNIPVPKIISLESIALRKLKNPSKDCYKKLEKIKESLI